jgi:predicted metal-dependent hydrolase
MAARRSAESSVSALRSFLDWLLPQSQPHATAREESDKPTRKRMRITLAGREVAYDLVRLKRKSVGMFVARDGLTVRAPSKIAQREIETILQDRAQWIVQQLDDWQQRTSLVSARYAHDGSLLFKGKRMRLRVLQSLFESLEISGDTIVVATPTPLTEVQLQTLLERWLRDVAQEEFEPTVLTMAQHIGVAVKRVKLTDTKTMWGSCTSDGVVRLTFRLIQLPPAVAHYVIAHEISHRREMNHSAQFWEWVRVLDPHYKSHRRTLNAYTPLLEEGR